MGWQRAPVGRRCLTRRVSERRQAEHARQGDVWRCGRRRGAEARRSKRGIASAERSGAREARTPGGCEPRSGKHQPRAAIAEAQRPKPVATHAERRRTRPLRRARTRSRSRAAKPEQASVGGRRRPKGKRTSRSGSGEASFLLAAPRGDLCQRLFSTPGGSSDPPAVRVPCRATARVLMHEAVDLPGSLGDPVPLSGRHHQKGGLAQ